MRILIDTNIFIYREDNKVASSELSDLFQLLNKQGVSIFVHKLSIDEISKDKDDERRKIVLSKIKNYPIYNERLIPEAGIDFENAIGPPANEHDYIDNVLLFNIYKNAFEFFVTEDIAIHRKAQHLGISDRVFNTKEALAFFIEYEKDEMVLLPSEIHHVAIASLNYDDPILDTLKGDYGTETESTAFRDWWIKISREGRKAWVYDTEQGIGALLILKDEDEAIAAIPPQPKKRRLKICTFIVSATGMKIGELFIRISVEYAMNNDIDEIYLTHFTKSDDLLIELIEEFGFTLIATRGDGESIYLKKLTPDSEVASSFEISRLFYPSFYDGSNVDKFVVPIQPRYYKRLFIDRDDRQMMLPGISGEMIVERNTIKKAYLSKSRITKLKQGDVLLFYRSDDYKAITIIGVVEKVYANTTDPDEIIRNVGKRSVYTKKEIADMAVDPTMVIIFNYHFHLNPVTMKTLKGIGILKGPPQTIQSMSHEKYIMLKRIGGVDERFTVN